MRHTAQRKAVRQLAPAAPLTNASEPPPLSEETRHKVLIVGGGFGGAFTTKHLRRRAGGDVHIELISRTTVEFRPCPNHHPPYPIVSAQAEGA